VAFLFFVISLLFASHGPSPLGPPPQSPSPLSSGYHPIPPPGHPHDTGGGMPPNGAGH